MMLVILVYLISVVTGGSILPADNREVTCPDGLEAVLGKCYKFSDDKKTWADARIECQSIQPGSYDLVVIDSEELNEYLKQYPDHWIGINDLFSEGEHTWVNGQPLKIEETFSQSPWAPGQPDNNGCGPGEDCVKLDSNGLWEDKRCRYVSTDGFPEKYICGPTGFETAGVRHEGEGCYASCGRWEGRCGYCGANGYCCKKDQKGCGCDGEMGVEGKGYVCAEKLTTGNDTKEVSTCHLGKECWTKCGEKDGYCDWCDGDGLCCREGRVGNGCDGEMGEKYRHTCMGDPAKCADRKNSCNGAHGLIAVYGCNDPYYGSDVRKWCRKSCGLCGDNDLPQTPTVATTTPEHISTTVATTTPEYISTTEYDYPINSWSLVGEMQECGGEEEFIGRLESVEKCAEACTGVASMFIFGTNDFGKNRCNRKGCKCYCETSAATDGTCNMKNHRGYRLYRYDTWGGSTDTDQPCEDLNTWGFCTDDFADWCIVDWIKVDCPKLCKQC